MSGGTRQTYRGERTGGRSADVRARVLRAAQHELLAAGYTGFSMSAVAQAAEVARTTIYRRWPTRAALVADVAAELNATWVPEPAPGPLRGQLREIAGRIAETIADPTIAPIIQALFTVDPADAEHVRNALRWSRSEVYDRLLAGARDRGEHVPAGVDGWMLMEAIVAPIWMRHYVTGVPITGRALDGFVDRALRGFGFAPGDGTSPN